MPFCYDLASPKEEAFICRLPVPDQSGHALPAASHGGIKATAAVIGKPISLRAAISTLNAGPAQAMSAAQILRDALRRIVPTIGFVLASLVICVVFLFAVGTAIGQEFDDPGTESESGNTPGTTTSAEARNQTPSVSAPDRDAQALRQIVAGSAGGDESLGATVSSKWKVATDAAPGDRTKPAATLKPRVPALVPADRDLPKKNWGAAHSLVTPIVQSPPAPQPSTATLPVTDLNPPDVREEDAVKVPAQQRLARPTDENRGRLMRPVFDPALIVVGTSIVLALMLLLAATLPRSFLQFPLHALHCITRRRRMGVQPCAQQGARAGPSPRGVVSILPPPPVTRSPAERWTIAVAADKGPVRKRMEDASAVFWANGARILVVADGVGGEPDGELAAETAVRAVEWALRTPRARPNMRGIQAAIAQAAGAVARIARDRKITFGLRTTLIVAAVADWVCRYGYMGDGGLVHLRGLDGVATSLLAPQRDSQGRLTASLGPVAHGVAIIGAIRMQEGDVILAGSDGLWERVSDIGEMARWLASAADQVNGPCSRGLRHGIDQFVASRDAAGNFIADDNVTVALIGTGRRPAFLANRTIQQEVDHAAA